MGEVAAQQTEGGSAWRQHLIHHFVVPLPLSASQARQGKACPFPKASPLWAKPKREAQRSRRISERRWLPPCHPGDRAPGKGHSAAFSARSGEAHGGSRRISERCWVWRGASHSRMLLRSEVLHYVQDDKLFRGRRFFTRDPLRHYVVPLPHAYAQGRLLAARCLPCARIGHGGGGCAADGRGYRCSCGGGYQIRSMMVLTNSSRIMAAMTGRTNLDPFLMARLEPT